MEVKFIMFKILGGRKDHQFSLTAISDKHAEVVADQFKEKCGLIGRYYCETESGNCFQV